MVQYPIGSTKQISRRNSIPCKIGKHVFFVIILHINWYLVLEKRFATTFTSYISAFGVQIFCNQLDWNENMACNHATKHFMVF